MSRPIEASEPIPFRERAEAIHGRLESSTARKDTFLLPERTLEHPFLDLSRGRYARKTKKLRIGEDFTVSLPAHFIDFSSLNRFRRTTIPSIVTSLGRDLWLEQQNPIGLVSDAAKNLKEQLINERDATFPDQDDINPKDELAVHVASIEGQRLISVALLTATEALHRAMRRTDIGGREVMALDHAKRMFLRILPDRIPSVDKDWYHQTEAALLHPAASPQETAKAKWDFIFGPEYTVDRLDETEEQ